MASTTLTINLATVLLLATAAAGSASGKDTLSITADAPSVPLSMRTPGRNTLRLPTLEYRFEIQVNCAENRSPGSLSLSVADTRKSLVAEEITANGPTQVKLKIPAGQIAPLVIENFCVDDGAGESNGDGDSRQRITIPSALSAQASLLCENDDDKVMTYVSRPLDVDLVCDSDSGDDDSGVSKTLIDLP